MTAWSAEQVAGLAPDAAALAAAQQLATAGAWPSSGASERALWGEAKGSGKQPYTVVVDLDGPAYRCSCPSRKFPCKHALGLLLRWSAGVVPEGQAPGWAREWLDDRAVKAAAAAERRAAVAARATPAGEAGGGAAAGAAGPGAGGGGAGAAAAGSDADGAARAGGGVGPEAARATDAKARRELARAAKISTGVADLDRWLADLVRGGLAAAQARPYASWDAAAARLVDAQAPGLAGRVRGLGAAAHSGPGWPARLLDGAARLHLASRAWERGEALPEATRADVRSVVGWPADQDAVRAAAPVADRWVVIGQRTEEDERLRTRRTWLRGVATRRDALVLSFAAGRQAFAGEWVVGSALEGDLAFFPGSVPLRALLLGEARVHADGLTAGLPGAGSVADAAGAWANVLARNPWHGRVPVALAAVTPVRTREGWALRDATGDALALTGPNLWELVALAGGAPLPVAGEWAGDALHPLLAVGPDGPVLFG